MKQARNFENIKSIPAKSLRYANVFLINAPRLCGYMSGITARKISLARKQKNRPGTAPDLLSSGYRGETSCPAFRRYRYKFHSAGH